MKRIIYVSGSRADYSPLKRTLKKLTEYADVIILATSMHLSPAFGHTIKEIQDDGFQVKTADMLLDADDPTAMVKSLGIGIYGIAQAIHDEEPDLVFVEGDRGESLAAAIVGAHCNIPVAHHGGGDRSKSIDDKIRDAITLFSNYHLAGNKQSQARLIDMGVQPTHVFNVGEPGLDDIFSGSFTPKKAVVEKYNIATDKPCLLLVQHPNTEEYEDVERQIATILNVIKDLKTQTIAIYSNADAGGRAINTTLERYSNELPFLSVYPHIERADFLGLMNVCDAMIGNTSAGIIELPSFKKPFVCIGTRQAGRLRAGNTIEVDYRADEIATAIYKALYDDGLKKGLKTLTNPYGDGNASVKIVDTLLKVIRRDGDYQRQ